MEIIVIPIALALFTAMVIAINSMVASVFRRKYLHRERMAAIEKGLPIPEELLNDTTPDPVRPRNHGTAVSGIIWTGLGAGILIAPGMIDTERFGNDFVQFTMFLKFWAFPSLLIGAGLLAYSWLIREKPRPRPAV